jgi:3-phenylpropionate/trans-cinnamate dioxygenase ferredoxin subunit
MPLHTLCRTDELKRGQMKAFTAGGENVLLYHLNAGFFATQSKCSHTFAPLALGKIVDDCQVRCPLHRARFDIRTGAVVEWANFPPGVQLLNVVRGEQPLRTYKVSLRDGQVRVNIPKKA